MSMLLIPVIDMGTEFKFTKCIGQHVRRKLGHCQGSVLLDYLYRQDNHRGFYMILETTI